MAPPTLRAALAAAAVSGGGVGQGGAKTSSSSSLSSSFSAPAYDRHFVLPEDRCLLLTDGCVALLVAKGIAAAQRAAEAGAAFPSSPLPQAPALRWAVAWRDVLAAEARRSGPDAAVPDRVLLHRIGSGGRSGGGRAANNNGEGDGEDDDDDDLLPLALGIRTHSGWCQAEAISATLERAAATRGVGVVAVGDAKGVGAGAGASAAGWGAGGSGWERAAAAAERASSASSASLALLSPSVTLPPSLPCLDFKLVWTSRGVRGGLGHGGGGPSSPTFGSSSSSSSCVSLWRPVPPPGYAASGDVAVLGVEPPPTPVAVYRLDDDDDNAEGFDFDDDDDESKSKKKNKPLPPTAPAAGFRLVWRHDGDCPLTLWEPLPPSGYRALGAAARGSAEPLRGSVGARARSARRPRGVDVACVRSDLCEPTRCFDAPVWMADPVADAAAAAARGVGMGAGGAGVVGVGGLAGAGATPHPFDPAVWRVSLWPVDAPSGGFIALRSLAKPGEGVALKARL